MLNLSHSTLCALTALALAACGEVHQATTEATTDTTVTTETPPTTDATIPLTPCPDHPNTDACCCFEELRDDLVGLSGTQTLCASAELCPEVNISCMNDAEACPNGPWTTNDEAALTCALQALQAGKPGHIRWRIQDGSSNGSSDDSVQLDLVSDRTALRQRTMAFFECLAVYPVERLMLPAPEYFTTCRGESSLDTRAACLRNLESAEITKTCLDGEEYGPFEC